MLELRHHQLDTHTFSRKQSNTASFSLLFNINNPTRGNNRAGSDSQVSIGGGNTISRHRKMSRRKAAANVIEGGKKTKEAGKLWHSFPRLKVRSNEKQASARFTSRRGGPWEERRRLAPQGKNEAAAASFNVAPPGRGTRTMQPKKEATCRVVCGRE